jgi:hypothetical protein
MSTFTTNWHTHNNVQRNYVSNLELQNIPPLYYDTNVKILELPIFTPIVVEDGNPFNPKNGKKMKLMSNASFRNIMKSHAP